MFIEDIEICIKEYPGVIKHVKQTEELCWIALRSDPTSIKYIKEPSEEMSLYAINNVGHWVSLPRNFCTVQTEAIKWALVRSKFSYYFRYIENPTEEMCLEFIRLAPSNLRYICQPTDEMKFLAVSANGWAIIYIEEQTEELCLLAVDNMTYKDGDDPILYFIKIQTLEICMIAINKNARNIKYVKDPEMRRECHRLSGIPMTKELYWQSQ